MRISCNVIATLGMSPAVLTELLYALVVGEGHTIARCEVWTTTGGRKQLQALLDDCREDSKRNPLPGWSDFLALVPAGHIEHMPRRQDIVIETPRGLDDIRTPADALRLDRQIFRRVSELVADGQPTLVGSLAGGRKTMSASLQAAFSMAARATDRLVHVLVHPQIEDRASGLLPGFVAPDPAITGLPLAEQIAIHEVAFPPLAEALGHIPGSRKLLRGLLDRRRSREYSQALTVLRAAQAVPRRRRTVVLHRSKDQSVWELQLFDGDPAEQVRLGQFELRQNQPAYYGALVSLLATQPKCSPLEVYDWLLDHVVEDDHKPDAKLKRRAERALQRLREACLDLELVGWSEFVPRSMRGGWTLPAHARVHFNPADLGK